MGNIWSVTYRLLSCLLFRTNINIFITAWSLEQRDGTAFRVGGVDPAGGAGQPGGQSWIHFAFCAKQKRRVESDRITVSLPFSPDPLKTPSRTSPLPPLPPLPPYPPPEHAAKDASGKSSGNMALFRPLGAVFGLKDGRTRRASLRYVGRGIRLFPGAGDASDSNLKWIKLTFT